MHSSWQRPNDRFHRRPIIRASPTGIATLARQMKFFSRRLLLFQDQMNTAHSKLPRKKSLNRIPSCAGIHRWRKKAIFHQKMVQNANAYLSLLCDDTPK
jgi:hypothetical protein